VTVANNQRDRSRWGSFNDCGHGWQRMCESADVVTGALKMTDMKMQDMFQVS